MVLRDSEVTDLIRQFFLFLMCEEAFVMRVNSSALVLSFPAILQGLALPKIVVHSN